MDVIPTDASKRPESFEDFINDLRRYKKDTILITGAKTLWDIFRNKELFNENDNIVFKAYGPKIISLALAVTNNFRDQTIEKTSDFYDLCCKYLAIPTSLEDKVFLADEAKKIEAALSSTLIPEQYNQLDVLRNSAAELFIQRSVTEQNQDFRTSLDEFTTDYLILKLIDSGHNNIASQILHDFFGLSLLNIFRSAFALFSLASDKNGFIVLDNATFERKLTEKLNITLDSCQKVAKIISYNESALRMWYESEVLKQNTFYQRYVLTPLSNHPLIYLDKLSPGRQNYFIPSPTLFFRGFRQFVFSHLLKKDASNKMRSYLGESIESHIFNCLKLIFGDAVIKIDHKGKKADFFIRMNNIDLIIETKTNIAGLLDGALCGPEQIAKVWSRLFSATEQCKSSIPHYRTKGRQIICIILVANHITAEYLAFQSFGYKTGLFNDLGIEAIEFIAWNDLETILCNTSLINFEKELTNKWKDKKAWPLGDLLALSFEKTEPNPACSYLKKVKKEILPFDVE